MTRLPRGLYAITDGAHASVEALEHAVACALRGGAVMIQYRDKSGDAARRLAEARRLAVLCRAHRARLIINDDVELALAVQADGVHLGKEDAAYHHARARLGADAIIGLSCYNDLARAQHAAALGADYLAFGSFFPSATKPAAVRAHPELLAAAKPLHVPLVAIGGITADNGRALVEAGADLLAVISDLFGARDITAAAARLTALFAPAHPTPKQSAP